MFSARTYAVLVTDIMLHNSFIRGTNMIITSQILYEIEFIGGIKFYCKLLQRRETVLPTYSGCTVDMHKWAYFKVVNIYPTIKRNSLWFKFHCWKGEYTILVRIIGVKESSTNSQKSLAHFRRSWRKKNVFEKGIILSSLCSLCLLEI